MNLTLLLIPRRVLVYGAYYTTLSHKQVTPVSESAAVLSTFGHLAEDSLSGLEQLISRGRKSRENYLTPRALRGPGGGYILPRPLSDVSFGDFLECFGPLLATGSGKGYVGLDSHEFSQMPDLLAGLTEQMLKAVSGAFMQDMFPEVFDFAEKRRSTQVGVAVLPSTPRPAHPAVSVCAPSSVFTQHVPVVTNVPVYGDILRHQADKEVNARNKDVRNGFHD